MSRRKRQPDQFDVVEFLRESDGDLKSALNSLLRSPSTDAHPPTKIGPDIILGPGLNLESPNGLAGVDTGPLATPLVSDATNSGPGPNLTPDPNVRPPIKLHPGLNLGSANPFENEATNTGTDPNLGPDPNIGPPINLLPGPNLKSPDVYATPGPALNLRPDSELIKTIPVSGLNLTPPSDLPRPKKRHFPIREMNLAQDAHTRAEQQVYDYLWQNATLLDDISRTITIGFGAMSRVVRLSESNARINVRSLIAKLAIEEFGDYNCERSVGRTYRILSYPEIMRRRREVGLLWYMRRTLAVVFVDRSTGQPIDLLALQESRKATQYPVLT
jgi:hypothetical protein